MFARNETWLRLKTQTVKPFKGTSGQGGARGYGFHSSLPHTCGTRCVRLSMNEKLFPGYLPIERSHVFFLNADSHTRRETRVISNSFDVYVLIHRSSALPPTPGRIYFDFSAILSRPT